MFEIADFIKARKESKDEITKVIKAWSAREATIHDKGFQDGAFFGYNKAKEEMQEIGLALQSDMDKTIEQNIQLKAQIEKMKCCNNCDNWNWKHNKCEKKLKGDCFKHNKWFMRNF